MRVGNGSNGIRTRSCQTRLVFAHIGLRDAGLSIPGRLCAPRAGKVGRTLIPLTSQFKAVAVATGRLYHGYRGQAPFAELRKPLTARATRRRPPSAPMATLDRDVTNSALAEATRGRLSPASLRWMRQPHTTGFVLTHQLLAWLLCVWNEGRDDALEFAQRLARRVLEETAVSGGYYDLLAQQTAFLALGAWPIGDLTPLVRDVLKSQDPSDGGWHYFDRTLSRASETWARVCCDRSPLLGWPIPYREAAAWSSREYRPPCSSRTRHRTQHLRAGRLSAGGRRGDHACHSSSESRLHSLSDVRTGASGKT